MRRAARKLVVVTTVVAMFAAMPLAFAAPPDEAGVVERVPTDISGFVYSGDGVHVLTGPPLEQGCFDEGFIGSIAQFVIRPNGSTSFHARYTEGVFVFDDMGIEDVFEWIGMACGAVVDGDPDTVPPEPLAVGEVNVVFHFRIDAEGILHGYNKAIGKVWTAEGKRVHLSTYAQFEEGPDYYNLEQLRVNYGGN